ncbi:hypothetical protein QFZ49_005108 [Streptomyces turgidiscabies]|uniref:Uncharacterized protein n=1 Tax=Streptomyces turgidiscabies TaxID=85558 RepID=A0ABU0RT14_9ACTN|nr:hypothetical protein [Streptomyces turgidiscabies]
MPFVVPQPSFEQMQAEAREILRNGAFPLPPLVRRLQDRALSVVDDQMLATDGDSYRLYASWSNAQYLWISSGGHAKGVPSRMIL